MLAFCKLYIYADVVVRSILYPLPMQTSMKITLGLLGILIIAGVAFAAIRFAAPPAAAPGGTSEMMEAQRDQMEAGEPMMTNDAMNADEMMKPEDGAMNAMPDDAMMKKDEGVMMNDGAMEGGEAMKKAGSYESYAPEKLARAAEGDVVLFFRASWCPTCRALDADIRAHLSDIPSRLTILDVNYDDSSALKQKYGVTYQHTLVQVDAEGNQIAKWSGSPTLAALVTQVK